MKKLILAASTLVFLASCGANNNQEKMDAAQADSIVNSVADANEDSIEQFINQMETAPEIANNPEIKALIEKLKSDESTEEEKLSLMEKLKKISIKVINGEQSATDGAEEATSEASEAAKSEVQAKATAVKDAAKAKINEVTAPAKAKAEEVKNKAEEAKTKVNNVKNAVNDLQSAIKGK